MLIRSQANYTKARPADCYTLDVCRTMVAMSHVDSVRTYVVSDANAILLYPWKDDRINAPFQY